MQVSEWHFPFFPLFSFIAISGYYQSVPTGGSTRTNVRGILVGKARLVYKTKTKSIVTTSTPYRVGRQERFRNKYLLHLIRRSLVIPSIRRENILRGSCRLLTNDLLCCWEGQIGQFFMSFNTSQTFGQLDNRDLGKAKITMLPPKTPSHFKPIYRLNYRLQSA
jgi:hypothetical protein